MQELEPVLILYKGVRAVKYIPLYRVAARLTVGCRKHKAEAQLVVEDADRIAELFDTYNSDDEVVIASGDRGIIAVPSKFMPNSLKRVSSLGGGNVRSVNRCGDDAIWGLVKFPNGDDGEEQRLIKTDKNLCPKAGISLPISQDVFLV